MYEAQPGLSSAVWTLAFFGRQLQPQHAQLHTDMCPVHGVRDILGDRAMAMSP